MKRISSSLTVFYRAYLPIVLLLNILIIVICFVFFNFSFRDLLFIIGMTVIFAFAWFFSFRKLKIVFLGNHFLEVNKEKIFFNNIKSVVNVSSYRYKVTYMKNEVTKSFIFMSDSILPFEPSYIRQIKSYIKNNIDSNSDLRS